MANVLLVEDDPLIYRLYEKLFKLEGFEIALAGNGRIALETLQTFQADIILLDIMMPEMNGMDFLTTVKSNPATQNIPVIVLTNVADLITADRAITKGAALSLVKSEIEPEDVVANVRGISPKPTQRQSKHRRPSNQMQPPNQPSYHEFLLEQIKQVGSTSADLPPQLLQLISNSYHQFDVAYGEIEAKAAHRTEQLMASTSRAYSFLDSLHMGFVMCDINTEIVLANSSVRDMLSASLPAGKPFTTTVLDDLLPEVKLKAALLQSLESGQSQELKAVSFGKQILRLFIAPMLAQSDQGEQQKLGIVVLVEDITEQKVLERSRDEFFSIASHELRTPLTAIRGNASVISKYYGDRLPDKDVGEMIADMHESAVRLLEIVNDFLDVSALEQGKLIMKPIQFSLETIAGEVVREMEHLCKSKAIALTADPSLETVPPLTADPQRIKQVLYNLIGNAIKFTQQGSITISARTDAQFVYVSVTDTGRGMPIESQRLLFRKFQQAGSDDLLTRDATKGTGLGLYISKLIVEQSGGTIGLEHSEAGQGSTFTFTLPLLATQASPRN